MPYFSDKLALDCPFFDKRTKLLPCQKELIKLRYSEGTYGIRELGRMFKVNKRLIQFILFPERQKKNLADRKARGGWAQYYDKEKNNEAQKEHRAYKYKTLKKLLK